MSGLKAVVLEKKGSVLTVLSADGAFQKVRHKGAVEIGEEIEISNERRVPLWRVGASVAAIFLMVFIGVFGWNAYDPRTAVAMISVDINPGLQLTLNRKGEVLELQSLNSDAEQLLSGLTLKGEPWQEALSQIIEQSTKMHYLNPDHTWVIVGYSPLKSESDFLKTKIDPEEIVKHVEGEAEDQGISPQIAVYGLTAEERANAQETGLTLGEYALLNTAKKAGVQVDPGTVKKTEERVQLLERPEIKEQMRKENSVKNEAKNTQSKSTDPSGANTHNFVTNLDDQKDHRGENGNSVKADNQSLKGKNTGNSSNWNNRTRGNSDEDNNKDSKDSKGNSKDKDHGKEKRNEHD